MGFAFYRSQFKSAHSEYWWSELWEFNTIVLRSVHSIDNVFAEGVPNDDSWLPQASYNRTCRSYERSGTGGN